MALSLEAKSQEPQKVKNKNIVKKFVCCSFHTVDVRAEKF